MRKQVVAKSPAPKKLSKIQFGTFVSEEIQKIAEFEVTSNELFSTNGIMDARLGISDKVVACKTCK